MPNNRNRSTRKEIIQKQGQTRSRKEGRPHPDRLGEGLGWCPDCSAVYTKKHWVKDPAVRAQIESDKSLKMLCQPDEMRRTGTYEGVVTIDDLDQIKNEQDLMNLIRNLGEASEAQDHHDQILRIERKGSSLRIETSDNQLATRIGKKVTDAFPDFDSDARTPKRGEEDVITVHLTAKRK